MLTRSSVVPIETPIQLAVVGERTYVPALELFSRFRMWLPTATVDFRFLQPMTCDVTISKRRGDNLSAVVIVEAEGRRERYFVLNHAASLMHQAPEPAFAPNILYFFRPRLQMFVTPGRLNDAIKLDYVFRFYQTTAGQRFIIARLRLRPVRSLPFDVLIGRTWDRSPAGFSARLSKNFRPWCELEISTPWREPPLDPRRLAGN